MTNGEAKAIVKSIFGSNFIEDLKEQVAVMNKQAEDRNIVNILTMQKAMHSLNDIKIEPKKLKRHQTLDWQLKQLIKVSMRMSYANMGWNIFKWKDQLNDLMRVSNWRPHDAWEKLQVTYDVEHNIGTLIGNKVFKDVSHRMAKIKNSIMDVNNSEGFSLEDDTLMRVYIKEDYFKSASVAFQKSPFHSIIKAGADFLKNQFSVMICRSDKREEKLSLKYNDDVLPELLFSRIASVTIPLLKPKTFSLKVPIGQVEKIAPKMEGAYEGTMNIRLDDKWVVLEMLSSFSNNDDSSSKQFKYTNLVPPTSVITKKRVDIIVNSENLYNTNGRKQPELKYYGTADMGGFDEYHVRNSGFIMKTIFWVFEDVKFLGVESLQFNSEGSGPTMLPVKFIAKRVYLADVPSAENARAAL